MFSLTGRMAFLALTSSLLFTMETGATSMNGQTIQGKTTDSRLRQCGIRIGGTKMAEIEPFIEFAGAFKGRLMLDTTSTSASGSNTNHQGYAVDSGKTSFSTFITNRPVRIAIRMDVTDEKGLSVCRIDEIIDLDAEQIKI